MVRKLTQSNSRTQRFKELMSQGEIVDVTDSLMPSRSEISANE